MYKNTLKRKIKIKISYPSKKIAEVILQSISPDNYEVPQNIKIITEINDNCLEVNITCESLAGLTATVDDLLSCIQAAEEAIAEVI